MKVVLQPGTLSVFMIFLQCLDVPSLLPDKIGLSNFHCYHYIKICEENVVVADCCPSKLKKRRFVTAQITFRIDAKPRVISKFQGGFFVEKLH